MNFSLDNKDYVSQCQEVKLENKFLIKTNEKVRGKNVQKPSRNLKKAFLMPNFMTKHTYKTVWSYADERN